MYATRPKGLLLDATFRKGFACLAPLGLSFDAWLFHPQLGEFTDLARAFPEQRIVLDHCGGPVGLGRFAGRREEIFAVWKASIQEVAKCPNVVVKLGGLAMRLLGFDFHERPKPPIVGRSRRRVASLYRNLHRGVRPRRCMFESNFPPDKGQCSYQVIFNAFKRIAAQYSETEKTALFSKTATDFYRLEARLRFSVRHHRASRALQEEPRLAAWRSSAGSMIFFSFRNTRSAKPSQTGWVLRQNASLRTRPSTCHLACAPSLKKMTSPAV